MQGTGGVRKLRWSRGASGKSGGVRVIHFYKKRLHAAVPADGLQQRPIGKPVKSGSQHHEETGHPAGKRMEAMKSGRREHYSGT